MSSAGKGLRLTALQAWDAKLGSPDSPLRLEGEGVGAPAGWFLGPKAENQKLLEELITDAIRQHCRYRRKFHREDPKVITRNVKRSQDYRNTVKKLWECAQQLFERLKLSTPIFSMRHQGHMLWDQALPAMVGYFAAMLCNQNNVAAEVSPVTTRLEIEVGNDLCRMLGFRVPQDGASNPAGQPVPWGHITCDGTVANIEGLWAARNAKFFPVALRSALRDVPDLAPARPLHVRLSNGSAAQLIELDTWALLNLKIDDVVSLPQMMADAYGIPTSTTTKVLREYNLQNLGLIEFYRRFMFDAPDAPIALVPSTCHYSWPKSGALLGLGQNNIVRVRVDLDARMDVAHLEEILQTCLQRHTPVIAVVPVIGSTEESAVDPLRSILHLRENFRRQGLDYAIHCDAAWGGYFNSMLLRYGSEGVVDVDLRTAIPEIPMSAHVCTQYRALREADSITVDPHKAGYVPYPAGGICYRNSAMRDLISLAAPVVFHSQSEPTVGIYGVEGSKPGAAPAAVWLAHKVVPPTQDGYGKILGQCMWTSKRMYCRLATMDMPRRALVRSRQSKTRRSQRFKITFFQMLPSERANRSKAAVDEEKEFIRDNFVHRTNEELQRFLKGNERARKFFMELGSDQVILAYSFNYFDKQGHLNKDANNVNKLNARIFELCSITNPDDLYRRDLIITSSTFDPYVYGQPFVDHYCRRLGVDPVDGLPIQFLISTTMDPWTTDTPWIERRRGNFLVVVENALRNAVHQALKDLKFW